jgi:ABC-type amino acid transport substrate-binding protein
MPFKKPFLYYLISSILLFTVPVWSQTGGKLADSWQQALKDKKGAITVLWDEIEPFIYRDVNGNMIGVEYELMEGLKEFVQKHYGVSLDIWWKDAKEFANIYPAIRDAKSAGIFGASYYSITDERKKEVRFSPPYMPDLNILVTNNATPVFESEKQFEEAIKKMQGYTQPGTTMQEDLNKLRDDYYTGLSIRYNTENDYEVMRDIAADAHGIGYVPVSIYVVALQRGIKVKRQRLFDVRREGFAVIYPKQSDWNEPVDAYFNSDECKHLVNTLIKKYLGDEVSDIILDISAADSLVGKPSDIELLTKEREIVTQRFMDATIEAQKQALEVERQRSFRNTVLIVLGFLVLLASVLFGRFRIKQKLNAKLEQRNQLISKQNEQIEQMNHLLKLKVLQARMNPHFLFNSLNSIQYFIAADDKKASLQYISRFSAFLRKVINFGDELSISVNDEAELLREYLWLEHTRFPGQFDYEIILPEDSQQSRILPLLTHGLVEAALYRGVLNLSNGTKGKIVIDFTTEDHSLLVHISDNGMSREQSAELEKKKGLLIGDEDMLSRRIKLFNRHGKKKIHLKLDRDEDLNRAILEIPQPLFES